MTITTDVKKQIIASQITVYENTRWQLEMQYRVNKNIGNTPEQLKTITDDLVKIEAALDEWNKILSEVSKEEKVE